MHSIKDRAVVVNGQIVVRPVMVVALTYDHRLLDGREAVTFLGESFGYQPGLDWTLIFCVSVRVKEYIEDPRKMLLA